MKKNVLIIVVIAIVALVGGLFFYKMGFNVGEDLKEKDNVSDVAQGESEKEVVEEKNIEFFNDFIKAIVPVTIGAAILVPSHDWNPPLGNEL